MASSPTAAGFGPCCRHRQRRVPWANLLRRVLSIEALACPQYSTRERSVPMTLLAFLTDPEVVQKVLVHFGLLTSAPALASTRSSGRSLGFASPEEAGASARRRRTHLGSPARLLSAGPPRATADASPDQARQRSSTWRTGARSAHSWLDAGDSSETAAVSPGAAGIQPAGHVPGVRKPPGSAPWGRGHPSSRWLGAGRKRAPGVMERPGS